MNSCAQCFLVAHVNRQEANLTWTGHTPLLMEEREREREISADNVRTTAGRKRCSSRRRERQEERDCEGGGGVGDGGREEQRKLM